MNQVAVDAKYELQLLTNQILSLRRGGGRLELPQEIKLRLCCIWKAGISGADIRRSTGVQLGQLKNWIKTIAAEPKEPREYRILKVVDPGGKNESQQTVPTSAHLLTCASSAPIVFRFTLSGNTIELLPCQLTQELLGLLAQC